MDSKLRRFDIYSIFHYYANNSGGNCWTCTFFWSNSCNSNFVKSWPWNYYHPSQQNHSSEWKIHATSMALFMTKRLYLWLTDFVQRNGQNGWEWSLWELVNKKFKNLRESYFRNPKLNKSLDSNGPFVLASRNYPTGARFWFPCFDEPDKKVLCNTSPNLCSGFDYCGVPWLW